VHVELIDTVSNRVQWADRYDRPVGDVFAIQDDITQRIVAAVEPEVHRVDMRRAVELQVESLDAYMLTQRGFHHFYRSNKADALIAEDCFHRAIELDPEYSMAYVGQAYNRYLSAQFGWLEVDRLTGIAEARDIAMRAIALDPHSPRAHFVYGNTSTWLGEYERGLEHLRTAIDRCPSFANALSALAYAHDLTGAFVDAVEAISRSIDLRPNDPSLFRCLPALSIAYYQMEQYEHAAEVARRSVAMKPDFWLGSQMLAAALGELGEVTEAESIVDAIQKLVPGTTASEFANRLPYADARFAEHVYPLHEPRGARSVIRG
jgi:tetratricopeptide (TPR) repeat protein